MIAFIQGKIEEIETNYVVINVGGIGYFIHISLRNYEEIKEKETIKLYTHLQIREDAHILFGFLRVEERTIFQQLISVSGVGPATAMLVLSTLSLHELQSAILNGDAKTIQSVKGIGEKTAKRITIDLKDKIIIDDIPEGIDSKFVAENETKQKAIATLVALGYNKTNAIKSVNIVIRDAKENLNLETIIKLALKK